MLFKISSNSLEIDIVIHIEEHDTNHITNCFHSALFFCLEYILFLKTTELKNKMVQQTYRKWYALLFE